MISILTKRRYEENQKKDFILSLLFLAGSFLWVIVIESKHFADEKDIYIKSTGEYNFLYHFSTSNEFLFMISSILLLLTIELYILKCKRNYTYRPLFWLSLILMVMFSILYIVSKFVYNFYTQINTICLYIVNYSLLILVSIFACRSLYISTFMIERQ